MYKKIECVCVCVCEQVVLILYTILNKVIFFKRKQILGNCVSANKV